MNNFGIGVDIEDNSRFERVDLPDNERFINKIFTKNEIAYCYSKSNPAPYLTARFCGKEAVIKALNNAGLHGITYSDIDILNDENGVPMVNINKKEFKNVKIKISLSHCHDKSLAFAVIFEDL